MHRSTKQSLTGTKIIKSKIQIFRPFRRFRRFLKTSRCILSGHCSLILSFRSRRTLESSSAKSSDKIFLLDTDDRRDDSKAAMYVMKTKNCPVPGRGAYLVAKRL